jgi:hypothetical protein
MSTTETPSALAAAVAARGRITEDDVRALRRALWGTGRGVDRAAAEAVLALHRAAPERASGWADLYREALAEFVLQDEVLDEAAADFLLRGIAADGAVEDATELRLLLDLVFRARRCPERLVALARASLLASVQTSIAPFYGKGPRRAGAVDADDVEAIRRLVYGAGGAAGMRVGEAEALWLAGLDRATAAAAADNAPAWRDLFVKALAMYLLLGRGTGERADAGVVGWIREHLDGGRGLPPNGRALVAYLRREAASADPSLGALVA